MKNNLLAEPDLKFIKTIISSGGHSVKNCYQCATCSVACSISHDGLPFPRKEMLFASWGLKDKLMADPDIWLCYNCQDCSARCPRGARPGDVLGAIRRAAIGHYSKPAWFNTLLNDPRLIPLLFLIPAMVIVLSGSLTGLINFNPATETIIFADFIPVSLIEILFIPLSLFSALVFFSFASLAFVAGAFAFALYFLNSHAPYSQVNPIKILANFSGIALICGTLWLMRDRIRDRDQKSSYFDWYLLFLAFFLGITGMMTQLTRLADLPAVAYPLYFVHIILAFNLVAFVPYAKLAHFVYRTAAVTFDSYVRSQGRSVLKKD